jgi:hypothetical protein
MAATLAIVAKCPWASDFAAWCAQSYPCRKYLLQLQHHQQQQHFREHPEQGLQASFLCLPLTFLSSALI